MPNLRKNLRNVTEAIRSAEKKYDRDPDSVDLVAVAKLHPAEAIQELYELGQRKFAENFVQEALAKQKLLADLNIQWHFIGSIQSNKTREIANHFSWVHSVDRLKIAKRLSSQRLPELPRLNICLQINLEAEESKSGIAESETLPLLDAVVELPAICVRGFMIVPKPTQNINQQRAVFARLRKLLERANSQGHSLDTLSMGMTADLEQAIAEGSTHVRIGTALFGERPVKSK